MKKQPLIIYFRESAMESIIADLVTFLFIAVLFAFNHFVLDDSKVAAVTFFTVFIIYTLGKGDNKKNTFYSYEEIIKHLQEEQKKNA